MNGVDRVARRLYSFVAGSKRGNGALLFADAIKGNKIKEVRYALGDGKRE